MLRIVAIKLNNSTTVYTRNMCRTVHPSPTHGVSVGRRTSRHIPHPTSPPTSTPGPTNDTGRYACTIDNVRSLRAWSTPYPSMVLMVRVRDSENTPNGAGRAQGDGTKEGKERGGGGGTAAPGWLGGLSRRGRGRDGLSVTLQSPPGRRTARAAPGHSAAFFSLSV